MPWAWKVHLKKPTGALIKWKNCHGKEFPGCIVDWMDSRGEVHHTLAPVYVKGDRKGMPKTSIHGCFTEKNGWTTNATSKEDADAQRRAKNRIKRGNANINKYKQKYSREPEILEAKIEKQQNRNYKLGLKDRRAINDAIKAKAKLLSDYKGTIIYNDAYDEGGTGKMRMAVGGTKIKNDRFRTLSKDNRKMLRNATSTFGKRLKYRPNRKITDMFKREKK